MQNINNPAKRIIKIPAKIFVVFNSILLNLFVNVQDGNIIGAFPLYFNTPNLNVLRRRLTKLPKSIILYLEVNMDNLNLNLEKIVNEDIFTLLGVESANDEQKDRLMETMTKAVNASIASRISELLSEEEWQQFVQLSESGETDKLVELLNSKDIDLTSIIYQEVVRFRTEAMALLELAKGK